MSQMSGADVTALRQLGHQMESASQRLHHAIGEISSRLASTSWKGPDARAFRQAWSSSLRSQLGHVAEALEHQGKELKQQAAEQEHASSGGGGVLGGIVGGLVAIGEAARRLVSDIFKGTRFPHPDASRGFPTWDPNDPRNYDRDGDGYVDGCFPKLPDDGFKIPPGPWENPGPFMRPKIADLIDLNTWDGTKPPVMPGGGYFPQVPHGTGSVDIDWGLGGGGDEIARIMPDRIFDFDWDPRPIPTPDGGFPRTPDTPRWPELLPLPLPFPDDLPRFPIPLPIDPWPVPHWPGDRLPWDELPPWDGPIIEFPPEPAPTPWPDVKPWEPHWDYMSHT